MLVRMVSRLQSDGILTRAGPINIDKPLPRALAAWLMEVAVVLSSGGNQ